ncbi:hypothetical protein [Williamsia sp. D3]|uniref:hypothetical protein n=1 Tax=Williamsia sp. D3 TaxID=1313067 RepID=UPI0003FD5B0E
MERTGRWEILAGTAGIATLGALAVGAAARSLTRRHPTTDPNSIEDFGSIYNDRPSIVVADDGVPLAVREVGPGDAPLTVVFCPRLLPPHVHVALPAPRSRADVG